MFRALRLSRHVLAVLSLSWLIFAQQDTFAQGPTPLDSPNNTYIPLLIGSQEQTVQSAAPRLRGPSSSNGTFTLSWSGNSGGQRTAYLEGRAGAGGWNRINVTGRNSRTFSKPSGSYSFRLQFCFFEPEFNLDLCEQYSNVVTVSVNQPTAAVTPTPTPTFTPTPTPTAPPTSPPSGIISGPTNSTGTYTLTWTGQSGGQQRAYLEERIGGRGSWNRFDVTGTNSRSFTKPTDSYSYRIQFCFFEPELNRDLCGPYSAVHTVTVIVPPQLFASNAKGGVYWLTWLNQSNGWDRAYLEERSGQGGWNRLNVTGLTENRLFVNRLGSYSYRLQLCNVNSLGAEQCGPYSSLVSVTVTPPDIRVPASTNTGNYIVAWSGYSNGNEVRAYLEERSGQGVWSRFGVNGATYRGFTKPNGTYSYRIQFCGLVAPSNTEICGPMSTVATVNVSTQPTPSPNPSVSIVIRAIRNQIVWGDSAEYEVEVSGQNGFSGPVTLSVHDLPAGIAPSFSSSNVSLAAGGAPQTVSLNLGTTAGGSPLGLSKFEIRASSSAPRVKADANLTILRIDGAFTKQPNLSTPAGCGSSVSADYRSVGVNDIRVTFKVQQPSGPVSTQAIPAVFYALSPSPDCRVGVVMHPCRTAGCTGAGEPSLSWYNLGWPSATGADPIGDQVENLAGINWHQFWFSPDSSVILVVTKMTQAVTCPPNCPHLDIRVFAYDSITGRNLGQTDIRTSAARGNDPTAEITNVDLNGNTVTIHYVRETGRSDTKRITLR